MPAAPLSIELAREALEALSKAGGNQSEAARSLNLDRGTFMGRIRTGHRYALEGKFGTDPVIPGFEIKKTSAELDEDGNVKREWVQQVPEKGDEFTIPPGHVIKGVSALVGPDERVSQKWIKTREGVDTIDAVKACIEELKEEFFPLPVIKGPEHTNDLLLNQYTVTDLHFGMLAWAEETGGADYDLKIAEQLLLDWFSAAIATAPQAKVAILAQLGDLLHHDAMESVTPTSRNVLDADSRLQKIVRVVIRVIRQCVGMLLQAHEQVHIIMASANHDPASSAWMRELLAALYENEDRVTVDASPDMYYVFEWGKTALFYHHGHRRGTRGQGTGKSVDATFAGKFREIYGRCPHSYGHIGHLHHDEMMESPLMKIERHRTLAPADAYAAGGGWLSGRDAKVITYHREFGEVSRHILSPQMVMSDGGPI